MMTDTESYFCLLDNVLLDDDHVELGEYVVDKMKPEKISEAIYNKSYQSLPVLDQQLVKNYAMWPWARLDKAVEQTDTLEETETVDHALRQLTFSYVHATRDSYWPFDWLVKTLNLLKPSNGPVMPMQYYHVTPDARKGMMPVEKVVLGEPSITCDQDGKEWPYLQGCRISQADVEGYQSLEKSLRQSLGKETSQEALSNAHLWIAVEYFERGNRVMRAKRMSDTLPPLLFYEFALEGLYIREKERDSKKKLKHRVPAAIDAEQTIAVDKLREFIGKVFWIRSKTAHGVYPIAELEDRVRRLDTKALFIDSGVFCKALVNLQEIVRRSIRFFLDKYVEDVKRCDVLKELDRIAQKQLASGL